MEVSSGMMRISTPSTNGPSPHQSVLAESRVTSSGVQDSSLKGPVPMAVVVGSPLSISSEGMITALVLAMAVSRGTSGVLRWKITV